MSSSSKTTGDSKKRPASSMSDFFKPISAPKSSSSGNSNGSSSSTTPPTKKPKMRDDDDVSNADPFAFDLDDDESPPPPVASSPQKTKVPVSSPPKSSPKSSPAKVKSGVIMKKEDAMEIDDGNDNDEEEDEDEDEYDLTKPTPPSRPSVSATLKSPAKSPAKSSSTGSTGLAAAREAKEAVAKEAAAAAAKKERQEREREGERKAERERERIKQEERERKEEEREAAAAAKAKPSAARPFAASSSSAKKPASRKNKLDAAQKAATDLAAKISPDIEVVMSKVLDLRKELLATHAKHQRDGTKKLTLADLNIPNVKTEVLSLSENEVRATIERVAIACVNQIVAGQGFQYQVPSRSSTNQLYVKELDRIVLKDKLAERIFASLKNGRKTAITTRIIGLIYELCLKKIHVTKRDLFYTDVKLFEKQGDSDDVIEDVACMLGCTRSSLNVVASEKGIVVGRISFKDDNDLIDCTKMGIGGKAIPPSIDRITDIKGDAKFVLLVEKDAAFMRLAEDRFYNKYPCCIITAKGQPDVATRLFLKKVKETLQIPVLGLVDADPYGLKILSVYMSGSKNMSYDSASLTTPDIKWLGVRPSDLDRYKIPAQCRLPMSDHDIKTGKELLEEEFIQKNPDWMRELKIMIESKEKAEIQALSSFGFQYLSNTYLPLKLQAGGWI